MAVSACPRVCPSIQFIVLVRVLVIVLDPVISSTSITITRTSTASLSTISELPGKALSSATGVPKKATKDYWRLSQNRWNTEHRPPSTDERSHQLKAPVGVRRSVLGVPCFLEVVS